MTEHWLIRCVICTGLMWDGGKTMQCCGVGPLCEDCRAQHRHTEIVTTADDTITIQSDSEKGTP